MANVAMVFDLKADIKSLTQGIGLARGQLNSLKSTAQALKFPPISLDFKGLKEAKQELI